MDWQQPSYNDQSFVKIPGSWLHLYYYEALTILFRFENALRIFVYTILKKEMAAAWNTAAIDGGNTIQSETKKRINQSRDHGYLGYSVTSPMLFLNGGELTQILTSDAYWKYFAPYFKASKAIVLTKLQEIGTVRNALAHFRPLKPEDLDLIKQNSRHLLSEIENCLTQVIAIASVVPTNTTEDWYTSINSIENPHFSTRLYQSLSEEWIRVELTYKIPTLSNRKFGSGYISYDVANLSTSRLISTYSSLRENCIYVTEQPITASINDKEELSAKKSINIVFPKKRLLAELAPILDSLKTIADVVAQETTLLIEDHLAKGQLIEPSSVSGFWEEKEKYWRANTTELPTKVSNVDDVEFWGQRGNYVDEFIAQTSRYPWMPSTVSEKNWFDP